MNFKFGPFLLLISLATLAGCNNAGTSSGIAQEPDVTTEPSQDGAICSDSVIDAGIKGSASIRGSISDVAVNPISDYPVTAYFDNSALSIKLSYWNGQNYLHETIAGAPAVNNISLKILPTGIPVLAWTNGGVNVFLASRSSALSVATATWNTRTLVNNAVASRAIKIDSTPTGIVGGAYLTDTAVAGKPRLILCQTDCHDLSNYQTMSTTNNVGNESTNILAAQTRLGFAWCGADTTGDSAVDAYYPVVTYARTSSARVTSCPNATLSNCLTGTNWTANAEYVNQSILNSALQIDSATANDSIKIAGLRPTAPIGIKTYVSGNYATPIGCQAFVTATTFDESTQTVGSATTGDVWFDFLRDSTGKFHLTTNSAATAVNYYNSASTLLSAMDGAASWNAVHTMNTSAGTVLARQGGAALTSTNDLYSTHFLNIAATKFNLVMNLVADTSLSSAVTSSQNSFVNNEGHIELTASNTANISLAEASSGTVAVAYVDFSAGARTTGVLKYSYRNGNELNSTWEVVTINGTAGAMSPSLKFDHLDRPWISFYDDVSAKFYLATNTQTNGSAVWQFFVFPATPTGAAVLPSTPDTSLMMYEDNGTKMPVMVVLDNVNAASKGVKSAFFNSSTSSWSNLQTIDSLVGGTASGLSSGFNESGDLIVAYLDRTAGATNFVKYASSTNGAISWATPAIVGTVAGAGQGIRVSLNPATSSPMILYHDRATNRLYRSTCSGSATECQTNGWSTDVLDFATGLSTLTSAATGTEALMATSIIYKDDGSYDILYPKGSGNSGNLERTKFDDQGAILSTASFYNSLSSGLSTTAAHNFGVAGHGVSAILNSTDQLVSVFVGPGNKLYQKSCDTLRE
jgi:hypothetical protein